VPPDTALGVDWAVYHSFISGFSDLLNHFLLSNKNNDPQESVIAVF
jgi:hypothetical protein